MIIGFDMDGVLCDINLVELELMRLYNNRGEEHYYRERKPLLNPKNLMMESDTAICVTARKKHLREITKRWMNFHYPYIEIHFFETDREYWEKEKIAMEKLKLLYKLNISIYIDDSSDIVYFMRKLDKENKIIFLQYGGRLNELERY